MATNKKAYHGPEADAATFATRQEFLDSLSPIPVESVDEDNRTCSYCWRSYGESTPGQDDAEAPVQFKCNHVFGENCMRSLFAMPEPVRVDLTPLSFAPGSKGADLGSHLSAYVDFHGVEKSALLTGGSREKDFTRLLHEVMPIVESLPGNLTHRRGFELLGNYWVKLVYDLFTYSGSNPGRFHLMENAIVMDGEHEQQQAHTAPPYGTSANYPLAFPAMPVSLSIDPGVGYSSSSAVSTGAPATMDHSVNPFVMANSTWEQAEQKIEEQQEQPSSGLASWKDKLSSKSKLDKLVEKHLELQQKDEKLEKQADKSDAEQQVFQAPGIPSTMGHFMLPSPKALLAQQNARKIRIKEFVKHLARSFAEVYEAYERYQYDEAVAAGLPPPVKKLRLADPDKVLLASPAPGENAGYDKHTDTRAILLIAIVHKKSLDAKGLEVSQPYSWEYTEDMDEGDYDYLDGTVDAERAHKVFAGKTIFLNRKMCKSCCAKSIAYGSSPAPPEYVFWYLDNSNAPDGCPKCRRVLFEKEG